MVLKQLLSKPISVDSDAEEVIERLFLHEAIRAERLIDED
jgi:hypothetical protein